jgi:hypothetical protein
MPGVLNAVKARGSGHESGRGVAKRFQRQRQHVTIWSESPAHADSTARTVCIARARRAPVYAGPLQYTLEQLHKRYCSNKDTPLDSGTSTLTLASSR